jgi:hypothetical protein
MPAPCQLYHGTSVHCLLDILQGGAMRTDLGDDGLVGGLSLSTSVGVARGFGIRAEEYAVYGEDYPAPSDGPCRGAVLGFDRAALAILTPLKRVRWDDVATEREVRALQPFRIEGALRFVEVGDAALEWYAHLADEFGFDDDRKALLLGLREHPLRRLPPDNGHAHPIPSPACALG